MENFSAWTVYLSKRPLGLDDWTAPICHTAHGQAFFVVKRFMGFLLYDMYLLPLVLGTVTNMGIIVVYTSICKRKGILYGTAQKVVTRV